MEARAGLSALLSLSSRHPRFQTPDLCCLFLRVFNSADGAVFAILLATLAMVAAGAALGLSPFFFCWLPATLRPFSLSFF